MSAHERPLIKAGSADGDVGEVSKCAGHELQDLQVETIRRQPKPSRKEAVGDGGVLPKIVIQPGLWRNWSCDRWALSISCVPWDAAAQSRQVHTVVLTSTEHL